jgi:hypothetical protein
MSLLIICRKFCVILVLSNPCIEELMSCEKVDEHLLFSDVLKMLRRFAFMQAYVCVHTKLEAMLLIVIYPLQHRLLLN